LAASSWFNAPNEEAKDRSDLARVLVRIVNSFRCSISTLLPFFYLLYRRERPCYSKTAIPDRLPDRSTRIRTNLLHRRSTENPLTYESASPSHQEAVNLRFVIFVYIREQDYSLRASTKLNNPVPVLPSSANCGYRLEGIRLSISIHRRSPRGRNANEGELFEDQLVLEKLIRRRERKRRMDTGNRTGHSPVRASRS